MALHHAGPPIPTPVALGGTGSTTASAARTALGLGTIATQAADAVAITGGTIAGATITSPGVSRLLGKLIGANMNVTTDQAIPISGAASYVVRKVIAANASANLTLAAGGVYTATAKGGSALVAAAQVYSALSSAVKFVDCTIAAIGTTDLRTESNLYLSLTAAQGSAATADVYVYGDVLS